MASMHPVVVLGSYMLDAERMPPDEFEMRLGAVQALMKEQGWAGLIAHGNGENSAFVTYATNYSPRTRQCLALVPASGTPRLLVWTTPRNLKDHAALASIDDVRIIGDVGESVGTWLADTGTEQGNVALVDAGNMRLPVLDAIGTALTGRDLQSASGDEPIGTLMSAKRPREMVMARHSAKILGQSLGALHQAWKSGSSATDAVLAAEGEAFANQAQDARTLFSLDGGRTLRPFDKPLPDRPERMAAYVAVRYQAYWADGFVTLSARCNKVQKAAHEALDKIIAAARPGMTGADLAQAAGLPGPFKPHAIIGESLGNGIGLSLGEAPNLTTDNPAAMVEDGTYSLRVGLSQGRSTHALVSAMVGMGAGGAEILWKAP